MHIKKWPLPSPGGEAGIMYGLSACIKDLGDNMYVVRASKASSY